MFLTMNIIEDILSSFDVESKLTKGSSHFSNIKICEDPGIDYANLMQVGDNVEIHHDNDNIIVKKTTINIVVNIIMDKMREFELWEKNLFHLIFKGGSLQDIINYARSIFHNAMFIADETDRIIARTNDPKGTVNFEWDNILKYGHMSYTSTSMFRKFREANKDAYYKNGKPCPTVLSPPGIESRGIQYRIHSSVDNKVLGLFVIIECETPITLGQLNFSEVLCDAIAEWESMHKDNLPFKTGEDLLIQLLENPETIDNKDVIQRFIPFCEEGYTMAVVSGCTYKDRKDIAEYIPSRYKKIGFFNYKDDFVIISPTSNADEEVKKLLEYIAYYYDAKIGISYSFEDLMQLDNYYKQAKLAISYNSKNISRLDLKTALTYLSEEMTRSKFGNSLVHPILGQLKSYDIQHNSNYYLTLYTFLRNERSLVDTAHALNIHRNSLVYRLEKLNGLINIDLDDPDIREYLLLSYRVDK